MRVISGTAGSIPLKYPKGARIRPTTDALRESLFSSLGDRVLGARFADLYAGGGSVGIEALSRGAQLTVFVERDAACVEALRLNLAKTRLADRAEVVRGEVAAVWRRTGERWGPFDLVFADPPYGLAQLPQVVRRLVDQAEGVAEGGLVIVQHARGDRLDIQVEPVSVRCYGETQLTVFEVVGKDGDERPCPPPEST